MNYDYIRRVIEESNIMGMGDCLLTRDIKRDLNRHIDIILELEETKKEIDKQIQIERMKLKELAGKWEI